MEKAMGGRLSNYRSRRDLFDEVFGRGDAVNPYYHQMLEMFGQYSGEDFHDFDQKVKDFFKKRSGKPSQSPASSREVEPETDTASLIDLLPRIIPAEEWERLEKGVKQRSLAINAFLLDIYHQQHILKDKIVPSQLVLTSRHYCSAMQGVKPAGGVYNHITGTDLIRHSDGRYYVLEDNVRSPYGIRNVLANREALQQTLQREGAFPDGRVKPLDEYTDQLLSLLQSMSPHSKEMPVCALLSEGLKGNALLEHDFLAKSMGLPLLEAKNLFVQNSKVYMRTPEGIRQVDVLFRHLEGNVPDASIFEPETVYGVPGLIDAYRQGNIALINAPGAGVADDKALYAYVPAMIRYYLKEEPLLHNIHTYHCSDDNDYKYILNNMDKLVIRPVEEFEGETAGILMGNMATEDEIEAYKTLIAVKRSNFIAQPLMQLSTHPTYVPEKQQIEPRFIDLRVFSMLGKDMQYMPKGGLTRVALYEEGLMVSSQQHTASKDTWVLSETRNIQKDKGFENRYRESLEREAYNYFNRRSNKQTDLNW